MTKANVRQGEHHRPGRGGVAPDSPEALPVLWEGRMVTTSKDADARLTQRLTTAVFAVCYPTGVTEETLQDTNLTEMNVGAEGGNPGRDPGNRPPAPAGERHRPLQPDEVRAARLGHAKRGLPGEGGPPGAPWHLPRGEHLRGPGPLPPAQHLPAQANHAACLTYSKCQKKNLNRFEPMLRWPTAARRFREDGDERP